MNGYVYTINNRGEVYERSVVLKRRNGNKYAIAVTEHGQSIIVSSKALELHNDNMWSKVPQKNVYVEKMIEALLDREDWYRNKANSTHRRIMMLKESVR